MFVQYAQYSLVLACKGSKNISIKMLKDVGMIVPKSRETSAVYISLQKKIVILTQSVLPQLHV